MAIDKQKAIKYWNNNRKELKDGMALGVSERLIIGTHLYRNIEILFDIDIGYKLTIYDTDVNEFRTGRVQNIERCRWQHLEENYRNACNICPGNIQLYGMKDAQCLVNSPFTYIKEVLAKEFLEVKDFLI